MNIVFLARMYKPHVGGVEKHVEEISKILFRDHRIIIITEKHDPELPDHEKYPESEVFRIPLGSSDEKSKKWQIWKWIWQHRQILYRADIIHIHDVFYWLLPVIPFILKPRLYMTFHGYEGSHPPKFRQVMWHKLAEWFTWGNICIGDFHRKWYHTHPDIVSYGAVHPSDTPKLPRTQKAVFLGRLDTDTGILDYLRAAMELKLPLDVYGDGPLLGEAKSLAKGKPFIKFFGFVPNAAAMLSKYKYAFTSRYLGILEALSVRVPVIAHFDSPIKYDYLGLAPFSEYIDIVDSPSAVADAVSRITKITNTGNSRVEAGYNWVKDQTWTKLAGQYSRLWQDRKPL